MRLLRRASVRLPLRLALAALITTLSIGLVASCSQASVTGSPVATNQVDLPRSYKFAPEDITVRAGTTVTWTNNDNFTHSVQLLDTGEVQMMRPGDSVTNQFAQAGLYRYICSLHPQDMKGTVLVVAAADSGPLDNQQLRLVNDDADPDR